MQNEGSSYSTQRIVKNTAMLYARMLLTVWLNLWATRLTLQNLGVDDLGTYGVVGSVVSLFGILTNGLTTAIQRFITYELGRGRDGRVNSVFCTSLNVILIITSVLVLLLEVGGLWVLNHKLNIPEASIMAARWVFHFTVISFVFNLISIPYNALIIAYERMSAFAAISVLQVALNCAAAWMLSLFASDRLVVYGAATAFIAILIRVIYQVYCHWQFHEARYHFSIDRREISEMSRFAGVSTLAGVFQMLSGEGIILVINLTFGVAINAVYAIAIQLKNMVLSFSFNLFKAIQPQIYKSYAEGNMEAHQRLVYSGSKLEVYLIYFLMIPFLFRTEQIMQLWLGEVPPFAVSFAQGTIFISLTYAAFEPIRTAVLATGQIARFMLIPDAAFLLVLPCSWLVALLSDSPMWMLLSIVLMDILACVLRMWLGSKVSVLSVSTMLRQIVVPAFVVALLDAVVCWGLSVVFPNSLFGLLLVVILNCLLLSGIIILVGLDSEEKRLVLRR